MGVMPNDYTVLDIETTGLSPVKDSIIELSALKVRNNNVVDEFSSLVKSNISVSPFITNLTGITNNMLETAPAINSVLPEFIEFISDDIILGHNVSFDLSFIRAKLKQYCQIELKNKSIDTRYIARNTLNLANYKLTTIAMYYGIDTQNNHRGLKDCYITYEVYNNLIGHKEPKFSPLFC